MIKPTLLKALEKSETDLLSFLENITDEDFIKKPSDTVWSMAEIVDHIILTEKYVLRNLQNLLHTDSIEVPSRHPNGKVEYLVLDRNRKVPAPAPLIPRNNYETKAVAIVAFQKVRSQSKEFIEAVRRPLVEIGFPHFTLGMLNGENWGTFIPAHCERHLKQMKEMLNIES